MPLAATAYLALPSSCVVMQVLKEKQAAAALMIQVQVHTPQKTNDMTMPSSRRKNKLTP